MALDAKWEALRKEFLASLGMYRHEAGGVRVIAVRKFKWKPTMVSYLINTLESEELPKVLRPVPEEIERLYSDHRLTLAGVRPHIEGIELTTRLDFPQDRKKPAPALTEKQQFKSMVEEYSEAT